MIKVGVIGFGSSAQTFHLPLLQASSEFEVVAVCTSKPEVVTGKYPSIQPYPTTQELLASEHVDLMIITAPNALHFSLAKLCLDNNRHVVLEKPMATNSGEAQELVDLAKSKSLLLSVFQNRRWDGDFLSLKKIIEQKQLGSIRYFESHFDRFRPLVQKRWKEEPGPGSGIWFDLGSHLLDQAVCLFGEPLSLTAKCLALRESAKTTDYFHVQLHYENLEVVLHSSCYSASPNMRFKLEGTQGSYVKYGLDPQENQLKAGMSPKDINFGKENIKEFGTLYRRESSSETIETEAGAYRDYYQGIANALLRGAEPPVDCEGVVKIIKLLELAEKSSEEGKTLDLVTP